MTCLINWLSIAKPKESNFYYLIYFCLLQSILIPLGKADSGDENTAEFQLDCSAILSAGQQGGMDCIQQSGGSSDIRTLGAVTHKITVRATDDSYQMTQQRMKEAEEERKGIRLGSEFILFVAYSRPHLTQGASNLELLSVLLLSLVILYTVFWTILMMLVQRSWYWIN